LHLQLKFSPLSAVLLALALKPKVKFCMQRSVNTLPGSQPLILAGASSPKLQ
jgi:hypothetical protein